MATRRTVGSTRSKPGPPLAESYPLSVVIPAHNSAQQLDCCLQALSRNSRDQLQVVVIDDASSDDTVKVAASHKERFSDLQIISLEAQQGPARARNEGLKYARHGHVLYLDSDVMLPPEAVSWVRETLKLYSHRDEIVGVLGTYSERVPGARFLTNFKNLYTCFLYRQTDTLSPFLHTPIFCIQTDLLKAQGAFDESLERAEDFRLGVTLGQQGYRFVIDWRIEGLHLKQYCWVEMLREDWRRIQRLATLRLSPAERRFSYRAHRFSRLIALVTAGPALVSLPLLGSSWWAIAVFLGGLFLLANARLLSYLYKRRGLVFALFSVPTLLLEMVWAEVALGWAMFKKLLRR